jgi:hypothetical protein
MAHLMEEDVVLPCLVFWVNLFHSSVRGFSMKMQCNLHSNAQARLHYTRATYQSQCPTLARGNVTSTEGLARLLLTCPD